MGKAMPSRSKSVRELSVVVMVGSRAGLVERAFFLANQGKDIPPKMIISSSFGQPEMMN